jgi:hypothetical protein
MHKFLDQLCKTAEGPAVVSVYKVQGIMMEMVNVLPCLQGPGILLPFREY